MSEYVHTFKAPTLDEAYRKMRKQLGEEAIVLRAAESYEGGVLGFMRRRVFTVTAALPPKAAAARGARVASAAEKKYAVQSPTPKTSPAAAPIETAGVIGTDATIKDTVAYFQKVVAEAQRRTQVAEETKHVRAPLPPHSERISSGNVAERDQSPIVPFRKPEIAQADMHKEIAEMHDMLSGLIADRTASGFSDETGPVFRGLLEAGCERTMCAAILGTAVKGLEPRMAKDPRVVRERVRIEMRKRIWVNEGIKLIPGRCTVVAVVGVTGVGKTTNLAKLAAYFSVHERARVALITANTYRLAAPRQLRG